MFIVNANTHRATQVAIHSVSQMFKHLAHTHRVYIDTPLLFPAPPSEIADSSDNGGGTGGTSMPLPRIVCAVSAREPVRRALFDCSAAGRADDVLPPGALFGDDGDEEGDAGGAGDKGEVGDGGGAS